MERNPTQARPIAVPGLGLADGWSASGFYVVLVSGFGLRRTASNLVEAALEDFLA